MNAKKTAAAKKRAAKSAPPKTEIVTKATMVDRLMQAARIEEAKPDWAAALLTWQNVADLQPDLPEAALGRAAAHRGLGQIAEAESVLAAFLQSGEMTKDIAISQALNAEAGGDWQTALACWQETRQQFPEMHRAWAASSAMLQILGRLDEAERLTSEALSRFPGTIDISSQHLNIAVARQDWLEAWGRWLRMERQHRGHDYLHRDGAAIRGRILDNLSTLDAESLQASAIEADHAGDWARSVERWSALHRLGNTESLVLLGHGRALLQTQHYEDADQVLQEGADAFPDHVELRANYAEVASARGDWLEAARRWEALLREHGDVQAIWAMAAIAYCQAGRFEEAERLLARAIEAEPERVDLRVHHAKFAERQSHWADAVRRWEVAHQLKPEDLDIRNSRGEAIWEETANHLESGGSSGAGPSRASDAADDDDAALKRLALRFEGLGDNCEFGIVQRRFGAEPIGLFRFAAIGAQTLIDLARNSFSGLGDPDFVELGLTSGDEYLVTDTRGLYHMHSFVRKGTVDEVKFLKQQITRLGYLKKKLFEDLEEGEKIFVYKSSEERLSDEILRSMRDAFSKFGNITLLGIRKIEDGHAKGSLHVLDDRILVGYVETVYDGDENPIDLVSWKQILQQADRHQARLLKRSRNLAEANAR